MLRSWFRLCAVCSRRSSADYLVLALGENGLDEVAVGVSGLRREGELCQAGPVRLGVEDRAPYPGGDGPPVIAHDVCGRTNGVVFPCCAHCPISLSRCISTQVV